MPTFYAGGTSRGPSSVSADMGRRLCLAGLVPLCCLAFTAAAGADGCPPQTCGTTGSQPPGSSLVFVRPNGRSGPLVAYDSTTAAERFRLPAGLLSADGTRYVTARRAVVKGVRREVVTLWDVTRRRQALGRYPLRPGVWPVAISADGYRVVLQERSRRNFSRFALLDVARARVLRRVELRGAYEAEALSPDARRLFLLHWTRTSYDLRTFDFATRKLRPTRLANPDEKMTGTSMIALATPDGRWLLTLYAGGAEPFVHALDLRSGIAHCIDLPWEGVGLNDVGTAAPALSPDRRKLYLANPLLGRLAVVDLARLRVVRDVKFRGLPVMTSLYGSWPSAAVTSRGRMLAFAGGRLVWLYDTAYGIVRGPFAASEPVPARSGVRANVNALAFAPRGRRLLALSSDRSHRIFDARTGKRAGLRRNTELFAIRSGGTRAAVAGYASTGGPRFVLPEGHASADGSSFFTALPRRGKRTAIERYSPATGRLLGSSVVRGRWSLGAVSPSGRKLALARHAHRTTWLAVVDAETAQTVRARKLRGVYTVEAVTDDGGRLFLIQHYRRGSYAVRALDLVHGRLWTATLREKGEEESPVMTGRSAGQIASSDGTWLLTLYLDTRRRAAFVHALNLRRAYAVCIDLPSRAPLRKLRDYSLALASGGLYAANGTLGVLAQIDLRRERVTATRSFHPGESGGGWTAGALSPDARTLYFASGRDVWRYDPASGRVRGPVTAPGPVLGFGFSRDGRTVYAARADAGVFSLTR